MGAPERLEVEARPLRGSTWWAAAGVLLLASLGVSRLAGSPSPPVSPTSPVVATTSASTRTTWPAGAEIGAGTLYVAAQGWVYRIEVGSGALSRTQARVDPIGTRLTPMLDGVLIWWVDGSQKQLLVHGRDATLPVGGVLRSASGFLPGPDGSVWAGTMPTGGTAPTTTWRLVGGDGRVRATVEVSGVAEPDGAGGLVAVSNESHRQVYPRPVGPLEPGELFAVGPNGYVSRTCAADRCTSSVHDRTSGGTSTLELAPEADVDGVAVAPGNRFVTVSGLGEPFGAVQVRELGSSRILHSFAEDGPIDGSAVWLSQRWLALVSGGEIVLYDAGADEVIRLDLPVAGIQQLVWQPA